MNDARKFLLSLAMFVTAFIGADKAAAQQISDLDNQIHDLRREITDLRTQNKRRIADSLRRNDKYQYVITHQAEIDSLRIECERLITDACTIVRRHNRMSVVPQSAIVFFLYSSKYPSVRTKGDLYEIYRDRIAKFDKKKESVSGFEAGVKNHFDSIMHAEIDRRQILIDSLLNKKIELVR